MPRRAPRTFTLTPEIVATHAGATVVCLDERAVGSAFRLHAKRPGAEFVRRVRSDSDPCGGLIDEPVAAAESSSPALCIVEVRGVLEQRAGYHDLCGGWTDGHDAVAERLCAALAEGNVLLVVDSPGGACAGLQEAVRSVLKTKAEHGRHVIAWADEQIGSAAAWWTLCVADELYVPQAGAVGSIGARWAHTDVSEALKKEGVKIEHICWPNAGKVALASDAPLSDLGRARAQRDINDAGEAFAAAVLAGPVARRTGLTREAVVKLSADMLTGRRAVDAGLADGVATFDEVMTYALALASGQETEMASEYEKKTTERFTDDGEGPPAEEPESEEEKDPEDEESESDDTPADAEGDEPEEEASDEDDEPANERKPESAAARAKAPRAMSQSASLAEILGASSDSMPALKTAAIALRQIRDHSAQLTGQRSAKGIVGGLSAIAEDAAKLAPTQEKMAKRQRAANYAERVSLLKGLAAANLPGYPRGELLVDGIDEKTKRRVVKPASFYAKTPLAELRGFVNGKLRGRSSTQRKTPFEPDRVAAEREAASVPGSKDQTTATQFGHAPEAVAKSRAALFGG